MNDGESTYGEGASPLTDATEIEILEPVAKWPTVVGVLSIIYAILGTLCMTGLNSMAFLTSPLIAMSGATVETPGTIIVAGIVQLAFTLLLGIYMLMGAVGLYRRRRKGVLRLKRWVIIRVLLLLVGTIWFTVSIPIQIGFQEVIQEAMNQMAIEREAAQHVKEFDADGAERLLLIQGGVMTGLILVYPMFLGFFLSRRKVEAVMDSEDWEL